MRIEIADKSVIFKESRDDPQADSLGGPTTLQRFVRDWAGLEFTSELNAGLSAKFYGASRDYRFILVEDLGDIHTSLANQLRGDDPVMASASLKHYLTSLGRLHAAAHDKTDHYLELVHKIDPDAKATDLQGKANEFLRNLERLNIPVTDALRNEVQQVVWSTLSPESPFATVTHGDPAPDNNFAYSNRLVLIDFEHTGVRSALYDAIYPRMCMPACWCAGRVPEETLEAAEALYRQELAGGIREAANDRPYHQAYVEACAYQILQWDVGRDIGRCFTENTLWKGTPARSMVLSHLETFIEVSKKHGALPELRAMAEALLEKLHTQWPEAKPLELYPAFR